MVRKNHRIEDAKAYIKRIESLKEEIATRRDTLRGIYNNLEDIVERLDEGVDDIESGLKSLESGLDQMSQYL